MLDKNSKYTKDLNRRIANEKYIMANIGAYWDCNDKDLKEQSIVDVLNYLYNLAYKDGYEMCLNEVKEAMRQTKKEILNGM